MDQNRARMDFIRTQVWRLRSDARGGVDHVHVQNKLRAQIQAKGNITALRQLTDSLRFCAYLFASRLTLH